MRLGTSPAQVSFKNNIHAFVSMDRGIDLQADARQGLNHRYISGHAGEILEINFSCMSCSICKVSYLELTRMLRKLLLMLYLNMLIIARWNSFHKCCNICG